MIVDFQIDTKTLSHCRLHSGVFLVPHIKEVGDGALPVVHDSREVSIGNVLLLAELPKFKLHQSKWVY